MTPARRFDLKKTEVMLRNDFEWRKQMKTATIVEDYEIPEIFLKYFPGGFIGQDKEGAIVWIDPCGRIDVKGTASRRAHTHTHQEKERE